MHTLQLINSFSDSFLVSCGWINEKPTREGYFACICLQLLLLGVWNTLYRFCSVVCMVTFKKQRSKSYNSSSTVYNIHRTRADSSVHYSAKQLTGHPLPLSNKRLVFPFSGAKSTVSIAPVFLTVHWCVLQQVIEKTLHCLTSHQGAFPVSRREPIQRLIL